MINNPKKNILKKLLSLSAIILFALASFAQDTIKNSDNPFSKDKGYRFIYENSIGVDMNYDLGYKFGIINGYQFNKTIFLGLGLGYKGLSEDIGSLYAEANLRVNFFKTKISPYLAFSCGISCVVNSYNDYAPTGIHLLSYSLGTGIDIPIANSNALSVGFELVLVPIFTHGNFNHFDSAIPYNHILYSLNLAYSFW